MMAALQFADLVLELCDCLLQFFLVLLSDSLLVLIDDELGFLLFLGELLALLFQCICFFLYQVLRLLLECFAVLLLQTFEDVLVLLPQFFDYLNTVFFSFSLDCLEILLS